MIVLMEKEDFNKEVNMRKRFLFLVFIIGYLGLVIDHYLF